MGLRALRHPAEDPNQLLLFAAPPPLSEDALRARLESALGEQIELVLTGNRTSVLTFKRVEDRLHVRLQRVFLEAPDEVIEAVASFLRRPATPARERVVGYFSSRPMAERRALRRVERPPEIRTGGQFHDLQRLYDDLNARYFAGAVGSAITWGSPGKAVRGHARGRGRSIRFGAYFREQNLIRLHPALDAEWVPRFFVESVVHHEMVHAVVPVERGPDGRRAIHSPEFRRQERLFYAFEEAARWERENLARLLAARG